MSYTGVGGADPYNRISDDADPCKRKHRGTDTSRFAYNRVRHSIAKSRAAILDVLRAVYPEGMTGKEIAVYMGKPFNCVSGRITEALEANEVRKLKATRDGGHVIVLVQPEIAESLLQGQDKPSAHRYTTEERQQISDAIQDLSLKDTLDLLLRKNLCVKVSGWETVV